MHVRRGLSGKQGEKGVRDALKTGKGQSGTSRNLKCSLPKKGTPQVETLAKQHGSDGRRTGNRVPTREEQFGLVAIRPLCINMLGAVSALAADLSVNPKARSKSSVNALPLLNLNPNRDPSRRALFDLVASPCSPKRDSKKTALDPTVHGRNSAWPSFAELPNV